MKKMMTAVMVAVLTGVVLCAGPAGAQVSQKVLDSISTPNEVETSIGTLKFLDGAPLPETAEKVYDYLDTARAADAFLKGMPGASVSALMEGAHSIGAVEAHEVMLFDKLMDPKSIFLTGNSSTVYCIPDLDLKRGRPDRGGSSGRSPRRSQRRLVPLHQQLRGRREVPLPSPRIRRPRSRRLRGLPPEDLPDMGASCGPPSRTGTVDKAAALCTDNVKVYPLAKFKNQPEDEVRQRLGQGLQHDPPEQHRVLLPPRQDHPV